MTKQYDRTVRAAIGETNSKFALAEALALDIPAKTAGDGADVQDKLVAARSAIIKAGGEVRSVATLNDYRKTAIWMSGGESGVNPSIPWVAGHSYTAHEEARKAGLTPEAFAADPKPARATRKENGKASKDGDPKNVVSGWSQEQRKQAVKEVVKQDGAESVTQVAAEADLSGAVKATGAAAVKATTRQQKEIGASTTKRSKPGSTKQMTDVGAGKILLDIYAGVAGWEAGSEGLSEPGLVLTGEEREALIDAVARTSSAMLAAEQLITQGVSA